jgi:peptidoglycan/xylan/chitin deacetylase (PgdA/CDA1 family)
MKRLFFQICERSGLNALFRQLNRGQIKVLLYHSISAPGGVFGNAVAPSEFRQHLHHLKRHYNVVGLGEDGRFVGARPDRVNVLITFDDGFVDNLHTAGAILHEEGLPAAFFIIADCMQTGAPPGFILTRMEAGQVIPTEVRTLDVPGVQSLMDLGMAVGSHGLKHVNYGSVHQEEALADAIESRSMMQSALGCQIRAFAFPWGKHRPGQPELLLKHFDKVFMTSHGFNKLNDRVFHRNEVADLAQMRCATSGALDFFSSLGRVRQWWGGMRGLST